MTLGLFVGLLSKNYHFEIIINRIIEEFNLKREWYIFDDYTKIEREQEVCSVREGYLVLQKKNIAPLHCTSV